MKDTVKSYVVKRIKQTKNGDVVKEFHCIAGSKSEAVRRFCYVTGEQVRDIVDVVEVKTK